MKWLVALRATLNLELTGQYWRDGLRYTPLGIARKERKGDATEILERLMENPEQTRQDIRMSLGETAFGTPNGSLPQSCWFSP